MFLQNMPFPAAPPPPPGPAVLAPPPTAALSVHAWDATAEWSLYERAPDVLRSPASIMKVATALLLVRRKGTVLASETVTVTSGDLAALPLGVSNTLMGLQTGDTLTYENLLYGLLLPSGNDAALVIARALGDEMFAETESGTSGVTRFVEAMNSLASEFDLTHTTFGSPHGVSLSDATTARDVTRLITSAYEDAVVRYVSATASWLTTITGPNARSFTVSQTNLMVSDINVIAGKTGTVAALYAIDGVHSTALTILWEAPNGHEIAIAVLKSTSALSATNDRYLDMRGIIYQIVQDFPYLDDGVVKIDPQFANVVLLAGGDADFIDESSHARTLTPTGVTRGDTTPLFGSHSFVLDGIDDRIEAADASELSFGSSDWAVEFWYAGRGDEPTAANVAFVSKYHTGANQREWTVQYDSAGNNIVGFASTNGTGFSFASMNFDTASVLPSTFFNGAKRHILLRRSGSEIAVYVNGIKGESVYNVGASALYSGTAKMMVGARQSGSGAELFLPGRIDEIRITKGSARQTGAKFTPLAKAFPRS